MIYIPLPAVLASQLKHRSSFDQCLSGLFLKLLIEYYPESEYKWDADMVIQGRLNEISKVLRCLGKPLVGITTNRRTVKRFIRRGDKEG